MTGGNRITVIIADDHQLFADGLEQLLYSTGNYEVIAKAANGRQLLQLLNRERPDLVLLDINMPLLNGIDTAAEIYKRMPGIKIVLVSMYFTPKIIRRSRELGINGMIPKDASADIFKETLSAVMNGETKYVNGKAALEPAGEEAADSFAKQFNLSARELEIIRLIEKGLTSKKIAETLFLSELTVETHRKNIFRKLNVKSIAALLSFVHENGM